MKKPIKCIDQMGIHHPYACLEGKSHITIKSVKNQKDTRISRSKGNVNLTDYWYSVLDSNETNNKSCSCQNIALLSDIAEMRETGWWKRQSEKYICIGFLKIAQDVTSVYEAENQLKDIIGDKGRLFRTLDNADIIIAFSAQKENAELLKKLARKVAGCVKDQRSIYFSQYYVYGKGHTKNDILYIEDLVIDNERKSICRTHALYEEGWFNNRMRMVVKRIKKYKEYKNKKMMSYYQSLYQILSVIGQYEEEKLRKDLFYIFYPVISAFIEQLEASQKLLDDNNREIKIAIPYENKVKLKQKRERLNQIIEESMSQFLETMELLIRHIGQSCNEMIGNIGHVGMPYDIPLRLCLMYIAFLKVTSDVLVEGSGISGQVQKKEFEYFLFPMAYTQTVTTSYEIGNTEKCRLICVKMPRHMLFMPRSFFVILAHELSHYAHDGSRLRKLRAKCIRKIVETVITILLTEDSEIEELQHLEGKEAGFLKEYFESLNSNIQSYLENALYEKVELENSNERKYHLDILVEELCRICREIFYDKNHDLERCVESIDIKYINKMRNMKYYNLYQKVLNIQISVLNNIRFAAFDNGIYDFINKLKRTFREIYADLSAVRLLNFDWDCYLEAYLVSESCLPVWDDIPPETLNRFAIVKYVLEENGAKGWERKEECEQKSKYDHLEEMKKPIIKYKNSFDFLRGTIFSKTANGGDKRESNRFALDNKKDWFYCDQVLLYEIEFFTKCDLCLKEYIENQENKSDLTLLRNLHSNFSVNTKGEDGSFASFFQSFDELTDAYRGKINEKYNMEFKEIKK